MKKTILKSETLPKRFLKTIILLFCCAATMFGATVNEIGENSAYAEITGTVTSSTDGLPVIGANVLVKGTNRGTVTDLDGVFTIEANPDDVLVISYLGFATQEILVGNQANISISFEEDVTALEEVVVIGYGTQKKSHNTGAISKVENKKLDQIAVARVDEALIGQVSGVNIQATSAEAGDAPTITIRGFGSINANSGPAVVVDGLVVDPDFLGNLDMNDIASFEVLKDAASAAIYGVKVLMVLS